MSNYGLILSRDSFLLGVELRIFWSVAFIYGLSTLVFLFHIITRRTSAGKAAQTLLSIGVVLQAGLILLRTFEAG
ncbi:MAG: hypothetical protein Q7T24_08420, partial [Deltaproteobacteria bacterium]|nr:hypothetical protein [Deltaproteobacteria bacterium]